MSDCLLRGGPFDGQTIQIDDTVNYYRVPEKSQTVPALVPYRSRDGRHLPPLHCYKRYGQEFRYVE